MWIRNTVTNGVTKVRYDETGNAVALYVGDRALLPSESGDLPATSYHTVPAPYSIANGKVVTMFGNTPLEMTLYKADDKYIGARSNEFGYANYEYTVQGPADLFDLGKAAANIPKDQASELHAKE